ncbi:hypothetical protein E2C01_072771 [Portunus trituberculatus]|uniref:Uncharacterized protein n=1 Tax=Portunus trituberculatus TaxID=210409 RepID=A0A5B7I822_PORTR|nr:hypothetical protein [Portunus trituberculatus]
MVFIISGLEERPGSSSVECMRHGVDGILAAAMVLFRLLVTHIFMEMISIMCRAVPSIVEDHARANSLVA